MALGLDLAELSRHLRQERLYVTSEREQLQSLYKEVKSTAEQLYHQSWISRQQKDILDALIRSSKEVTPAECCRRTTELENTNFVDGYKYLSYHDSKYGEFLKYLLENPILLGQVLAAADHTNIGNNNASMVKTLIHSIYGNCVVTEDENMMLQMLKCLMELQLATCDNPRLMLRRGSCAFSIAFKQLYDISFSAKLFLTAALHDPVMRLLMEDEWFYDIDPGKALVRFPPNERQRRFGEPGTDVYKEKLAKYRVTIVDKLVTMASRFISSIKNNMHCFPSSLGWLVSQVYQTLQKTSKMEMGEVRSVCADLVFALFICPAICDPEPHGITTDIPISHIARHNLMQMAQIIQVLAISQWEEIDTKVQDLYGKFEKMAQIIQVLAISQWEEIDTKVQDLYGKFEKGCISSLLDSLLDGMVPELPTISTPQLPCLARTSSLIQLSQINSLVALLRSALPNIEDSAEKKGLDEILSSLTPVTPVTPSTPVQHPLAMGGSLTPSHTPPGTPSTERKSRGKKKSIVSMMSNMSAMSDDTASVSSLSMEIESQSVNQVEDVLVISLGDDSECPGMLTEQKVISCEQENKRRRVKYQGVSSYDVGVGTVEIQGKRTRFSLSHDQESIGNTSDIQEAISEGASSHSVASQDLENEDDNDDNFSDMISANVSGQGTPNISGRDTPMSQAESMEQENPPNPKPVLPETVQKSNRVDVTDKFGKFDIKHELEYDDFKSTVSDTWSTDVLASDSEPPEMNQQVRLEEISEEMVRQNFLTTRSEISETASDAWSTDVLASDTDEKQVETLSEFDELGSVSEMGSNLDEVRSESDVAEAPLASDFQNPGDNRDLLQAGALGPSFSRLNNETDSPTLSDNVFNEDLGEAAPPIHPRLGVDLGDNSAPPLPPRIGVLTAPHGFDSNKLFVPIKRRRAPSPPGLSSDRSRGGANNISANRISLLSNTQNRLVDKYVLDQRPVSAPVPYRFNHDVEQSVALETNILITPDSGARPKVSHNNNIVFLNKNFNDKTRNESSDFSEPLIQAQGNGNAEVSEIFREEGMRSRVSADSGVSSAQFLDPLPNEDIKPSEQQNTNLDETHFSAALSLFDPLTTNSENSGDLLEGAGSPPPPSFPEVYSSHSSTSAPEPLINITDNGESHQFKPVINGGEPGQFAFDLKSQSKADQVGVAEDGSAVYLATAVSSNNRRGSSDSSHSSSSNLSKEESGLDKAEGRDAHSQNMEDRKSLNGASSDGPVPSKSRSFFKSVKEKINRVVDVTQTSSVIMSVHAGRKKKYGKHDKEASPSDSVFDSPAGSRKTSGAGIPVDASNIKPETSDDILEKYRSPKSILTPASSNDAVPTDKERRLTLKESEDGTPLYDPTNLENCLAFLDAKRKLRMVLSTGDFQTGQGAFMYMGASSYSPREVEAFNRENNDLVNLLRAQLSEAINLQSKDTIAQLHEALRCVRMFDTIGCKKLVRSLQDDYRSRSSYVSYLVRSKQGLLSSLSHLQRLLKRIQREKEVYDKHMTNVCVRLFLENWEKYTMGFMSEFQKLTVSDEKTDLVERFLQFLYQHMNKDNIWLAASETQLDDAKLAIERYIMSRIYTHAMFPNGDGDVLRDQIIQKHIKELSKVISPTHDKLCIPRMYHLECPWPAAQREIYMINAYKTPKDKLLCIVRCSKTIMNLLSMANEKSVPAADDFMPVFIFVIIKANPPCLLSTIQYVNSFYGNRLHGEEQYWWMQFSAAVEFIKTMN